MTVSQPVVPAPSLGDGVVAQIRANVQAARLVATGSSQGCSFCGRQGIPILPLRYAVIPDYLVAGRGADSVRKLLGDKDSALGAVPALGGHRYAVRALREGFLYVYLNSPGLWQVYSITAAGHLRLLPDPDDIDAKAGKEMSIQCRRSGDHIPASFLHIEDPARTPVIWLAFSSARWSATVRQAYETDPSKRMQRVDVSALSSAPNTVKDAFGLEADAAQRLEETVEEYIGQGQGPANRQTYVTRAVGAGGDPVASLPSKRLQWKSTHEFRARLGQASVVQQYAQRYVESTGSQRKVAAVVLHDAMGMLQELDASRQHLMESMQVYMASVARPLTVSQSIVGLKKIVEESLSAANDSGDGWSRLAAKYSEANRARFESTYQQVIEAFNAQIKICDADWAAWAQQPSWKVWMDDYDPDVKSECARFTEDYAACLAGGVTGDESIKVWKKWIEDAPDAVDNPVYLALFFKQMPLAKYLLPEADSLNKGDKLYDALRGLAGSDEFKAHVTPQLKAAVASLQTALTGAHASLETQLEMEGKELAQRAKDVALRAQQGVMMLYEGVETTALRVRMTVGEYHRVLSEQAFRQADGLAAQAAQGVRKSVDASGRQVRSLALAGLLSIDDPKVRDTLIEVVLWGFEKATDLQRQLSATAQGVQDAAGALSGRVSTAAGDIARAGGVLVGAVGSELRVVSLRAALLSHDVARQLNSLRAGIRLSSLQLAQLGRNMASHSLRVAGSGSVILAAGSLFFQGWSLRDSLRSADKTLGASGMESQLALISPAVGVVGASLEVLGFSMNALGKQIGKALVKIGGGIAAGASLVDAVQSGFAAARTWKSGDRDAANLYGAAAVVYLFGAAFGGAAAVLGSSALLGPLGIALALIALGVVFTWMAINAEDSQAEIWLDRCYFGHGKRSEGRWQDSQAAQEMAALNAILVGLSAKISFSDAWLGIAERISGYERIDVEIRIVGFNEGRAGYEWNLSARHDTRGHFALVGGRHQVAAPPTYMSATPSRYSLPEWMQKDDPQLWTREIGRPSKIYADGVLVIRQSVEVLRSRFKEAALTMNYWPDYTDQAALARIELQEED